MTAAIIRILTFVAFLIATAYSTTLLDEISVTGHVALGRVPTPEAQTKILVVMLPAEVIESGVRDWKFTKNGPFRIKVYRDLKEVDIGSEPLLSEIKFQAGDRVTILNYKKMEASVQGTRLHLDEGFEKAKILTLRLLDKVVEDRSVFQEWQKARGELKVERTTEEIRSEEIARLIRKFGKDRLIKSVQESTGRLEAQIETLSNVEREIEIMANKTQHHKSDRAGG